MSEVLTSRAEGPAAQQAGKGTTVQKLPQKDLANEASENTGPCPPPLPVAPQLSSFATMPEKLFAVQSFIEKLQYNYTPVDYFDVRKNRPMSRILDTSRKIIRDGLPIKCVEAVFLALFLTQGLQSLERIPMSFKSRVDGHTFKHIVLAVRHQGMWGALGLSRRPALYWKPLVHKSLGDLYAEFRRSYTEVHHSLVRVKVGLPVGHDAYSTEYVCWAYRSYNARDGSDGHQTEVARALNGYAKCSAKLYQAWRAQGGGARVQGPRTAAKDGDLASTAPPQPRSRRPSLADGGSGGEVATTKDVGASRAQEKGRRASAQPVVTAFKV